MARCRLRDVGQVVRACDGVDVCGVGGEDGRAEERLVGAFSNGGDVVFPRGFEEGVGSVRICKERETGGVEKRDEKAPHGAVFRCVYNRLAVHFLGGVVGKRQHLLEEGGSPCNYVPMDVEFYPI